MMRNVIKKFHLEVFFRSLDIWVFVLTFLVMWQNGLIRKIRLISIFYDITAWLINSCSVQYPQSPKYCPIYQTVEFGWLVNITEAFFLEGHAENVVEKLVSDPFLEN